MCWMKANRIDPSLAVGFKFSNYEEFESWTQVKPNLKLRAGSSVRNRVGNVTEFRSVLVLVFSAIQKFGSVLVPFLQCQALKH